MDDFFEIKKIENLIDDDVFATIKINTNHEIFEGHFPDNPVVPGVLSVDVIKRILSVFFKCELRLVKAGNIKYTKVITPKTENLNVKIANFKTSNIIKTKATIIFEDVIFLKFSGTFEML